MNIELNNDFTGKPVTLGHHRRIGTVGGMLNGRINRTNFGRIDGAVKVHKINVIGSGSMTNPLGSKKILSD